MDPEPQAGLETGLQHGSKVHPEMEAKYRPRNNLQGTFRMSNPESRSLQHSTKEVGSPTAKLVQRLRAQT